MDNFDKIARTGGKAESMAGQPWRIGTVKSVNPYKVDIAGIVYEGESLFVNWLFTKRDWEMETISFPDHPEGAYTSNTAKLRWKQDSLLSVGDTVAVLLVDDQTAYLIAKVVRG